MKFIRHLADPEGKSAIGKVYWNSTISMTTNIAQNVLFSAFFVILARHFGPVELSEYVIANSLYQLVASISAFGLADYFVREYTQHPDARSQLTRDMVIVESLLGFAGYGAVVALSSMMGYSPKVQALAIVLAINVNFDNLLVSLRSIYVAESKQLYMGLSTLVESLLKLLAGFCVLLLGLSLWQISVLAVALRLVTLCLAFGFLDEERRRDIRFALNPINVSGLRRIRRMLELLGKARNFAVISTLAFLYWRLNTLVLGKLAPPREVSFFDVGTKVFFVFQILPFCYLQALFPVLSQAYRNDRSEFIALGRKALTHLGLFSSCIAIPVAFASPQVLTVLFGSAYLGAARMTSIVMITLIPFSLGLVQAYVLIASRNERVDMWLNVLALGVNALLAVFLTSTRGGIGAGAAILTSFSVFFVAQQIVLLRKGFHIWRGLTLKLVAVMAVHLCFVAAGARLNVFIGIALGQVGFWSLVFYWKLLDLTAVRATARRALGSLRLVRYSRSVQGAR